MRVQVVGCGEAVDESHTNTSPLLRSDKTVLFDCENNFGSVYNTKLDLIFAEPDGMPLKPNTISSSVSALFKRLKIPKPKGASLHLLRHSHRSYLLAARMELPAVSERLGHSSVLVKATVYSHRITRRDEEAATNWDEFQRSHDRPGTKQ